MHTWRTLLSPNLNRGRPVPPSLVVVHCTEGATASGAALWLSRPTTGASCHVAVDEQFVYRVVNDADVAWHARGVNSISFGLEIVGFARWSRAEWLEHLSTLTEAARIHAGWCRAHGIPLVQSMTRGYHSHAGLPGNDHTDPGPDFPWDVYLDLVRGFLGQAPEVAAGDRWGGRSLRLVRGEPGEDRYARWGGWTVDEVPAGWDGPALGPLTSIAALKRPTDVPFLLTWQGGKFDDPGDLPRIARSILTRSAKEAA